MKNDTRSAAAPQLWGIYHLDREYARELGDPLRTVIEASSKELAEQEAERLGFSFAWAHTIKSEEIAQAQWLPARQPDPERIRRNRQSHSVHV
jgi:hypothetical protein